MEVQSIPISELHSDPANVRKHDDKNIKAIAGSLKSFGLQKPIVVDGNNVVIAGNGTLAAAQSLGWQSIDCVRTELTGPEAIAFALADNRTAELADWDMDGLNAQLDALFADGFDIADIGFDLPKTDELKAKSQKTTSEHLDVTCPECGHEWSEVL